MSSAVCLCTDVASRRGREDNQVWEKGRSCSRQRPFVVLPRPWCPDQLKTRAWGVVFHLKVV